MIRLADIIAFLEQFAPLQLAEDWDNVGLIIGDERQCVERVMTCLTLSPDVAEEAIAHQVDLIVAHHPVLFRPVQRLIARSPEGGMLLRLIASGVAVYSPHTAFDSAMEGINQGLAESLGLIEIDVIRPFAPLQGASPIPLPAGSGRRGRLPQAESLAHFLNRVRQALSIETLQYVGDDDQPIERVAVACGSAAEFLQEAQRLGCDVLVTGEARFHACQEARTLGMAMVLAGHYATERPAVERLAAHIASQFTLIACTASQVEQDPIRWSKP